LLNFLDSSFQRLSFERLDPYLAEYERIVGYFCDQLVKMENAQIVGILLSLLDTWCSLGEEMALKSNGPNLVIEFIFDNEQAMEAIEECRTKFAGRFRKEANALLERLNLND